MKRWGIFVMLALVAAQAAFAEGSFTGRDLHRDWTAYERVQRHDNPTTADLVASGEYSGYVRAVSDAIVDFDALSGTAIPFELPNASATTHSCAAVGAYLDAHADLWDSPATWIILQALEAAFPKSSG